MDLQDIVERIRQYQQEHDGELPAELTRIPKEKLTKREYNEHFLSLPMEEQVREIEEYKKNRWKFGRKIPYPIMKQIDMSDKREVNMWKSIGFRQKFPFLRNETEKETLTAATVLFHYRIGHGIQVTNIDKSDDPILGMVVDYERPRVIWVELLSVTDRVWREVSEVT